MNINQRFPKFQDGGPAPDASQAPQGGAPAPDPSQGGGDPSQGGGDQSGQDPIMQLVQLAQQALQGQDCKAALSVCDGLLQVLQQAQGQGGDAGAGGAQAPQGAPVYRKGGKLVRRINN